MSITLNVSPKIEAQLVELAAEEGIDPAALVEKMVEQYHSRNNQNKMGDKTLGDMYGHLLGTITFEPADIAAHDEEYLQKSGFGEISDRRGPGQ